MKEKFAPLKSLEKIYRFNFEAENDLLHIHGLIYAAVKLSSIRKIVPFERTVSIFTESSVLVLYRNIDLMSVYMY